MNLRNPKDIAAVLFDFGGVIADEGFADGLRAIAESQGLDGDQVLAAATDVVYDSGYVTGKGSERDFWRLMRERTGIHGDDEALRNEILPRFLVRPSMLELVEALHKRGLVVGLLSDQTDWLDKLDAEQHFKRAFDYVFNSHYLGKGKRDASLFADVAKRLGLRPEQIVFFDDNEGNVKRARSQGLQAFVFDNEQAARDLLAPLLNR